MAISIIYRSDLRITSKETAKEFYQAVKATILIPMNESQFIRCEPNFCISVISKASIKDGSAPFIPSIRDTDGTIAYNYRKYINAYLRKD